MARPRQHGNGLPLLLVAIVLAVASAGALALSSASTEQHRQRASERALAQAREALLAFAADRPIDARVGPGYLPCPDLDDDGWAEATCGSLSGHIGQDQRLGRLPWKTLGLPDLRDGYGERLWYAVSTRYKGLLNCAASRPCVDMTPPVALGTITVRDAAGHPVHDGTLADAARVDSGGVAAVILAPGPVLRRRDGHEQRRDCAMGLCDARGRCLAEPPRLAARCDPRNYLDASAAEDNAGFHDRSDEAGRGGNVDGFIQGPVASEGRLEVNDRVAVVTHGDAMARVMSRVAIELAHCLRTGGVPPPDEACPASPALGRIADVALGSSCAASLEDPGWWRAWRPHVLQALAGPAGLELVDGEGRRLGAGRRFAVVVTRDAGSCAPGRVECDASGCWRAIQPPRRVAGHDALVASP
ncbi:MAG TPA: hypothetical protein VFV90_03960 [Usitatibacter sp.]|nr:hypothetical protein [Usitatibacter sp.]